MAGIRVDGNKQIGLRAVRDGGALLERHKSVVVARVDHVRAGQLLLDQRSQAQRHVEAQILLHQAVRTDGAGVVAAVAGVDHDAADFQSQSARQRALAVAGGFGLRRGFQRSAHFQRFFGKRQKCFLCNFGAVGCLIRRRFGGRRRGVRPDYLSGLGRLRGLLRRMRRRLLAGLWRFGRGDLGNHGWRVCRGGRHWGSRVRHSRGCKSRGGTGHAAGGLRRVYAMRVNVDHEAVGIGQQKGGIILVSAHIQHQPHDVRLVLRHAHRFQEPVVHIESFTRKFRAHPRFVEIEINAIGRRDAGRFVFDRVVKGNDYPCRVGRVPRLNAGYVRGAIANMRLDGLPFQIRLRIACRHIPGLQRIRLTRFFPRARIGIESITRLGIGS